MITLRPYQQQAETDLRAAFAAGRRAPLLVAPTGAGKAVILARVCHGAADKGKRVYVMVHTVELVDQLSATLTAEGVRHGIIAAGYDGNAAMRTQVCSVQTLVRRLAKVPAPDLIITDECFAAGTLIDGVAIEHIKRNDMVRSFNHASGKVEMRRVLSVMRNVPKSLCTVRLTDGRSFVCTESHPFYCDGKYINASSLTEGSNLSDVRGMPESISNKRQAQTRSGISGARLLLARMLSILYEPTLIGNNGDYKSQVCFAAHEGSEPDAQESGSRQDGFDVEGYWSCAETARRQWQGIDSSSSAAIGSSARSWLRCGTRLQGWLGEVRRISDVLQTRLSQRVSNGLHRGRWWKPLLSGAPRAGCEKADTASVARVASVEIHQRTSDGTFGGLLPDGHVYNFEVDGNHNYFANGVLVHNCHHSAAGSYLAIYKQWPNARRLGVTATPRRLDGRGLGSVYDAMIETPDTAALIEAGYLSPFKVYAPPTVDASGLHVRAGDYAAEEVDQLMSKAAITGDAISHYRKLADGKRAVVFAHNIKAAGDYAAAFRDAGYPAFALDGRMDRTIRRDVVRDFRDGRIQVVTSCAILSEGFDLPAIECGIFLRPTASLGLWRQQVGRCLRLFDGKSHAILLDHVGNTRTHGLPDDPITWSLDDAPTRKKKSDKPPPSVRVCVKCWATARMAARICPECGTPFPVKERQIDQRDGELVEIQRAREVRERKREQGSAQSLEDLTRLGIARGMKNPAGWAAHVFAARERKRGAG